MKKLTLFAAIAMFICSSVMAASITYSGQGMLDGTALEATVMGANWDYEAVGSNPLIQLFANGALVDETTIGAGQYVAPVDGMFAKTTADFDLNPGDALMIKIFATADGSGAFASGMLTAKTPGTPSSPADFEYNFGTLNIVGGEPVVPEPSILLSGLALLAFRRKK